MDTPPICGNPVVSMHPAGDSKGVSGPKAEHASRTIAAARRPTITHVIVLPRPRRRIRQLTQASTTP